MIFYEEIKT